MEKFTTKVSDGSFCDRLVQKTQQLLNLDEGTKLLQISVLKAFVDRMRKDSKKPISSDRQDNDSVGQERLVGHERLVEQGESSRERKRKPKKEEEVKKKKAKFEDENLDDVPECLSSKMVERIDDIGGTNVELVITKRVFQTDLNTHHDRLAIPKNQIKDGCGFLMEDEKEAVIGRGDVLVVKLLEPCGKDSYLKFVKWNSKQSYSYVLRSSWKDVLKRNTTEFFKLGDIIQLWSFRVDGQLCFALEKVRDAPQTPKKVRDAPQTSN